jgi:hypothetical protein
MKYTSINFCQQYFMVCIFGMKFIFFFLLVFLLFYNEKNWKLNSGFILATTWVSSLVLFSLVIFEIGFHFMLGWPGPNPPVYASLISGVTGTCHHIQLFIGWDEISQNIIILIWSSEDYRLEPLYLVVSRIFNWYL